MRYLTLSTPRMPGKWHSVFFSLVFCTKICFSQNPYVSLPRNQQLSIAHVLEEIKRQTLIDVGYSLVTLQGLPLVELDLQPHTRYETALDQAFAGLRVIHWSMDHGTIIITRDSSDGSPYKPVAVRVLDDQDKPLPTATLYFEAERKTFTADSNGIFRHVAVSFITKVKISYTGFASQVVGLSNKVELNIVRLQPFKDELGEVVVRGYDNKSRRLSVGSETEKKAEEINAITKVNALDALQGRVPGLFIQLNSGVPGTRDRVLIRGVNSIQEGITPLFVVNNIPMAANGGTLTTIGSGSAQSPYGTDILNSISPDLIETITVLRGPDATAIYGSRATNGVILIKLKRADTCKFRLTADAGIGTSRAVKTSPLLNTTQFLALRREAVINDELTPDSTNLPEQSFWGATRNGNFKKATIGGAAQYSHGSIELSWRERNTSFLVAANTLEQTTAFPGNTDDDRQSFYSQLHYQSPDSRLTLDAAVLYNYEHNRLPIVDFSQHQWLAPDAPSFYSAPGHYQWFFNGLSYDNIPALTNNGYQAGLYTIFTSLQVDYALPFKGWSLENRLGYNNLVVNENSWQPIAGQDTNLNSQATGQTYLARNEYSSPMGESMVHYQRRIAGGKLDGVGGVTWQAQNSTVHSIEQAGYSSDLLLQIGAPAPQTTMGYGKTYYRYDALFGQFSYIFSDKFIFDGSWRRDGTSRFSPSNRYGDFWSVSAGWIFSDYEGIRQNLPGLSYGKLRGSYGTTGNDEIGNTSYRQLYNPLATALGYQGLQEMAPDSLFNSGLRWEISHMEEAALELGFLQNRILFTATGYYTRSMNQLVTVSLASQAGRPGILANEPIRIVNEGLEFTLDIKALKGPLTWTSSVNLTLPRNRLVRYPGLASSPYGGTLVIGKSIDATQAYHFKGIDPQTGIYQFEGQSSNGTLTHQDLVASPAPDQRCFGGWDNSFQYGRFALEIFVQAVFQDGYNPLGALYMQNPPGVEQTLQLSNGPVEWLNHWRYRGDQEKLQMISSTPGSAANNALYTYVQSDANIINASYFRLSKLLFSYSMPDNLFGKTHAHGTMYVEGKNLLTLSGYPVTDPETQSIYVLPPMRSWLVGIKFRF